MYSLATYFVVIGVVDESLASENGKAESFSDGESSSKHVSPSTSPGRSSVFSSSMSRLGKEKTYVGTIVDRFPLKDHPNVPIPPHLWMFCLPEGVKIYKDSPPSPQFSNNVLTLTDATRMYVSTLTFYEPFDVNAITKLKERFRKRLSKSNPVSPSASESELPSIPAATSYAPKCLCILSMEPYFNTFKEYLKQLYLVSQGTSPVPIERYISNLIYEAKYPPFGNIKLQLPIAEERVTCSVPSPRDLKAIDISFFFLILFLHISFIQFHFPFHLLFECLNIDNILTIIEAILCEKKILLVSSENALLTYISEALLTLIYPFNWPYVYVPVLPFTLLTFLEAPTPFILGINSEYLESSDDDEENMSEIVIVDLDRDKIKLPSKKRTKYVINRLPERKELLKRLRGAAHPELQEVGIAFRKNTNKLIVDDILNQRNKQIRMTLLEYFASMLYNWRDFLVLLEEKPSEAVGIFNKSAFIKAFKKESPFLEEFLGTYIFDVFIEEHASPTPNIFDDTVTTFVAKNSKHKSKHKRSASQPEPDMRLSPTLIVIEKPTNEGLELDSYPYGGTFPRLEPVLFAKPKHKELTTSFRGIESFKHLKTKASVPTVEYELTLKAAEEGSVPEDVSVFLMEHVLDKVFRGATLDNVEIIQMNDLFKQGIFRNQFITLLTDHKAKRASNVLGIASFKQLGHIMNMALDRSNEHSDFNICKQILLLGSTFCIQAEEIGFEFIRTQLTKSSVWTKLEFWVYAFNEDVKSQEEKQKMHNMTTDSEPTVQKEHLIFGSIVNIAYSMLNLSLPRDMIFNFMHQMCKENSLGSEQEETLRMMVDKMYKLYNEPHILVMEEKPEPEPDPPVQKSHSQPTPLKKKVRSLLNVEKREESKQIFTKILSNSNSNSSLKNSAKVQLNE